MQILIVGAGGREHALGWKIAQSPLVKQVFFTPGNPGTAQVGTNLGSLSQDEIVQFCRKQWIDLVVVGPEQPLVEGLGDVLAEANICCFGPSSAAARLEGSKAYAKQVMEHAGIPTAAYGDFDDYEQALAYLRQQKLPIVIKADGLAGGKGVVICDQMAFAEKVLHDIMCDRQFGNAGKRVVIEAFLQGTEASFHVLSDGTHFLPLITAQDHKTLLDGNRGPNTGGMGTLAPNPLIPNDSLKELCEKVAAPALRYMAEHGAPFRGVLFVGLMLTADGPVVLEYNARFGDPETQVLMPLIQDDLVPILFACARGKLPKNYNINVLDESAMCVVLAAEGYPQSPRKGDPITGWQDTSDQCAVFHAGTALNAEDQLVTAGGRVLGVTAWGKDLENARTTAYERLESIKFDGKQYRKDIGGNLK